MNTVPAYRGEFGLKVRFHVPAVFAACRAEPTVVEIEEGEEALYPNAAQWRVVPRDTPDKDRHGSPSTRYDKCVERFRPRPHVAQLKRHDYDVLICPRRRSYVEAKNWPHWDYLTRMLQRKGLNVFAGGVADSSFTTVPCDAAWNFARPLDATIEVMRSTSLVVAACSGLAHLAVLCGSPLLMFSHGDRVSTGPVYDSHGRFVSKDGKALRWREYYLDANHTGAPLELIDAWSDPEKVLSGVVERVTAI